MLQLKTRDILPALAESLPPDAWCVLGVTAHDLYPHDTWSFVFGEALLGERVGVFRRGRLIFSGTSRPSRPDIIERFRIGIAMTQLPSQAFATDAALVARVAAGDVGAFGELYRRRRGDVYRFALHMTGSRAAAEDVAQDAFLAVMRSAARYDASRATPISWLCGIARNCVRQRLDRERPFQPLASLAGERDAEPTAQSDPLGELELAEGIERLRRMVLSLPVPYREAVVLCDLQELSYADAAAAMRCGVGTVRSRLHRGRELLAAKLGAERRQSGPATARDARCTT